MVEKFTVAYVFEGTVAQALREIADELSEQFGIPNRYEYAPPHITLKYPVEDRVHRMQPTLEALLQNFCSTHSAATMTLAGLHVFADARVLFAEVEKSRQASVLHMEFMQCYLTSVEPLVTAGSRLSELFQKFDFAGEWHATIAARLGEKFDQIWKHCRSKRIERTVITLDKMTLIGFDGVPHSHVK